MHTLTHTHAEYISSVHNAIFLITEYYANGNACFNFLYVLENNTATG